MKHSSRAKQNMTNQLKGMLVAMQENLKGKRIALKKAKSYAKYNLPGTKSMVSAEERGIEKVLADIESLKIRIRKRYKRGEIFKIL